MHRSVSCPSCEEEIHVPEEFLGRNMKCTFCGAPLFAPLERKPAKAAPSESVVPARAAAPKKTDPMVKAESISPEPRTIRQTVPSEEEDLPTVKPVHPVRREQPLLSSGRYEQRGFLLFVLTLLPLGILLVLAIGAKATGMEMTLPMVVGTGIGFGTLVLCMLIAIIGAIPVWGRVVLSLAVTGLGYLAALIVLTAWILTGERGSISWFSWKEFSPADSGFRVEMPGTPRLQTEGSRIATMYELRPDPDNVYVVGYADIPLNEMNQVPAEERFINVRNNLAGAMPGGKVTREGTITLAGLHPGREYELDYSASNNGKGLVRIFIVQRRVYVLVVAGKRLQPGSADANRFLNSFKLTSAPSGVR